jgi:hypothetical protein
MIMIMLRKLSDLSGRWKLVFPSLRALLMHNYKVLDTPFLFWAVPAHVCGKQTTSFNNSSKIYLESKIVCQTAKQLNDI